MIIKKLHIENLRVFEDLDFYPVPGINLITGSNGVGKTTLLESIYLLARTKSFRTNKSSSLIRSPEDHLLIRAIFSHDDNSTENVGLRKYRTKTQIHLSGTKIKQLSRLAKQIPLGLVTSNTHKLFEEGPKYRRKLLHWGVFHVEPLYATLVKDFKKILLQRNSALKQGNSSASFWDRQFVEKSLQIMDVHERYIDNLNDVISTITCEFKHLRNLKIKYKSGWFGQSSFINELNSRLVQDQRRGFTSIGSQLCDLDIRIDNKAVTEVLSRGQQKTLGIILILSQLEVMKRVLKETPILLVDDFPAELDYDSQETFFKIFSQSTNQIFLTAIEPIDYAMNNGDDVGMFHVEHGEIILR